MLFSFIFFSFILIVCCMYIFVAHGGLKMPFCMFPITILKVSSPLLDVLQHSDCFSGSDSSSNEAISSLLLLMQFL